MWNFLSKNVHFSILNLIGFQVRTKHIFTKRYKITRVAPSPARSLAQFGLVLLLWYEFIVEAGRKCLFSMVPVVLPIIIIVYKHFHSDITKLGISRVIHISFWNVALETSKFWGRSAATRCTSLRAHIQWSNLIFFIVHCRQFYNWNVSLVFVSHRYLF